MNDIYPIYMISHSNFQASFIFPSQVDLRLQLHDPEGHRLGASVINPSILLKDGEALVLARRHRRETMQRSAVYNGP